MSIENIPSHIQLTLTQIYRKEQVKRLR